MIAFATPEELSAWTGGKISPTDPRSQPLLDGASAAVIRYCGWHITPVVVMEWLIDGPGSSVLQLPTLNLDSLLSVTENNTLLDEDDYEWSATGEIRRLRNRWPALWTSKWRGINVSAAHGFEDAADVKQVVLQVCAAALSSPMGATREQAGQVSVQWATTAPGVAGGMSLLARDFAVLDQYKLPGRL